MAKQCLVLVEQVPLGHLLAWMFQLTVSPGGCVICTTLLLVKKLRHRQEVIC